MHEFVYALGRRDFIELGRLLKQSHESLRDDFEVSTPTVDALVEKARPSIAATQGNCQLDPMVVRHPADGREPFVVGGGKSLPTV